ncbi:MAG TPA: hypothetical protein IAC63_01360 [Candidatus Enterousia avicola]|uniref:Uncharacterized protein n=1 Tax=Candidatus Enterousia avicola TaxID=2840787 RepID=A0A9D1SLW6_9PROT|nr:hypothetical protein [Candidatus Enterousia avicola]
MAKDEEEYKITDATYRFHNPEMEKALKEHEEENLRRAEEKEKELLERPTPVLDAFMNGVDKISKLLAKKKKTIKLKR